MDAARKKSLAGIGILGLCLALAAWLWQGRSGPATDLDCMPPGETLASMLAVGDSGEPLRFGGLFDPPLAVAAAIDQEHLREPVDALLLLGDNFYPDGLSQDELGPRLRMNVVEPFCRFLSLAGVHRSDLASACPIAEAARRPRPLLVVLGNHDYRQPESPELEAIEIPRWIPEWHLSSDVAEVYELPGSVSVIALDSVRLRRRQDPGPIVDALKRARGDWRIVIAHHPFVANGQAWDERYLSRVREAVAQSGVSIHMLLAGHEHLLAAGITGLAEMPLQLVAGSGAHARPAKDELLGRTFELVEPGFIRIELIRGADGPALHAALIATASSPIEPWVRPHVVACYSVDRDGRVQE